ncbi:SPFH domain-containing protein [Candidatus Parcubacteria bacterium]|nr:SPFH domain-containing protein [Candidatus Parcubacteria bacterium]
MTTTQIVELMAAITAIVVAVSLWAFLFRTPAPTPAPAAAPPAPNPWWKLNTLAYPSEINLTLGAVLDLAFTYVGILILEMLTRSYMPRPIEVLVVLTIAIPKYLWSTNLFRNKVETFEMGSVTYLERLIPSGPTGDGLLPGYYWFPLGYPFYELSVRESTREITIDFDQMQVWLANSQTHGQGAVNGVLDGNAQFAVIDPGRFKSVTNSDIVLNAMTQEGARDVCERLTIEEFVEERNDKLAEDISTEINTKLVARPASLGVKLMSVNVTRTDLKSEAVKGGWERVNVEQSLAVARKTDADARRERIKGYAAEGVDPNRAAALDAVVSDKAGATVGDQRYNLDVGNALKDIGKIIANKLGGRP